MLWGRRGPVWIDVPQDIQNSMIEEENLVGYIDDESENLFDASAADKAIEILKKCKRPCILMGSGIQTTQSENLFEEMLNKITIPVVGGAWLGDIFYLEHPLYYGLSGNAGPRTGNFILQNSDCILAIGNSLSYKQTGYDLASFAPNAKKIMVDVDVNEYLKIKNYIDLLVNCDVKDFIRYVIKKICLK